MIGLPQINCPSQVCEECVVGKHNRDRFPTGKAWRARNPLELIHSDICGPINPVSNGKKRYFISFIDDFSRKTWVYFLQEKSEALPAFKSFKALAENETGRTIKILRSDRGGEYNSKDFESFCALHGIRRQLTTAYTPQQNGVSERKNRTILNMVRSMLAKSLVPKVFWPEAVNWSVHILNRSPTFAVQNMTPEEAWSGRKPSVDHLRIFGCIAFAHIPDEKRKKLDDKSEKCVFLGVSEVSKAYKLFNPFTKKIIISRDVVFDEEKTWNWVNNSSRQQPIPVSFDEEEQKESNQQLQPSHLQLQPLDSPHTTSPRSPTITASEGAPRPQRSKKRPAWMTDYEVRGIVQTDDANDTIAHYALFSDCEPCLLYTSPSPRD